MNGVNDANDVNDLNDQAVPAPLNGRPPPRNAAEFRAHMRRANSLVAERRLADAELEIVRALEGDPDDLQALKLLALVRFRLGRLEEAGEAYRQVTSAAPGDAAARMNLGLIALKLERFEEAAAELETALRLRPDDQRAHELPQLRARPAGAADPRARAGDRVRGVGQTPPGRNRPIDPSWTSPPWWSARPPRHPSIRGRR